MADHEEPRNFCTDRKPAFLMGLSTRNPKELAVALREVPRAAISCHTHHTCPTHHFETPSFTNDVALGAGEAIKESAFSEDWPPSICFH
jgi:hypothetical protein